jgi:DNA repair exonuclease SbcCD ATPase subunit
MAEVMEAPQDSMALQKGAVQARRKRANKVITTGMHGSHRNAQPRPPPPVVVEEPTPSPRGRARGRTTAIVGMEQASAERDAAYQRELAEAERPRPPQKLSELEAAFGDIDKVCVGLLREGKVPEALQYLETLRGMVDTIVTQLEPKVAPKDRLVLPQISGLTPRPPAGRNSNRRALSERGSNASRMGGGGGEAQTPTVQAPKDGPRRGDDRLMELKNAEAKKLREQLREKDEKIAEQAKRLEEVDEKIGAMKEKHKRVESQGKLAVRSAESKVETLTVQLGELTAENKKLRSRYEETAAVVGLEYQDSQNGAQNTSEQNQEWEGKVRDTIIPTPALAGRVTPLYHICVVY